MIYDDSPETYVFAHSERVLEKPVPTVPSPPELEPVVHALDYGHPRFREPDNGELVVGIYRGDDGAAAPLLLWMDTPREPVLGRGTPGA